MIRLGHSGKIGIIPRFGRGSGPVGVPRPNPCYLDQMIPIGAFKGKQRWKSRDGKRVYEWDDVHGHIEGYNSRGRHVGVFHAVTGEMIKPAVKGRRIDV